MIGVWIWAVGMSVACAVLVYRHRQSYRRLDLLLTRLIEGQRLEEIEFDESAFSLLSNHLKTVSDKLSHEIGRADQEKEQIKRLISDISHQLKTPLSNVMMYEELLEDPALPSEQRNVFMSKLKLQLKKIDWLLNSLFKMARLEQNAIGFQVEQTGIRKTIQDAIGMVYDKAEHKGIRLEIHPFADLQLLHDPAWTAEVFANLLENAIKYTSESGQIEISLESLENYSIIHIKDNGIGISGEEKTHIFERFYRGKDARDIEGSGIGLYLSKMIVEREKGYMTVKSEIGKGSDFAVFLQNC